MSKAFRIGVLLSWPLVVGLAGEVAGQEPAQLFEARTCGRIGIAFDAGEAVIVDDVLPGSPAERAGIQPNDTLVAVDDTAASKESLESLPHRLRPGEPVRIRFRRNGEERDVMVKPAPDVCVRVLEHGPEARGGAAGPLIEVQSPRTDVIVFRAQVDTALLRRQAEATREALRGLDIRLDSAYVRALAAQNGLLRELARANAALDRQRAEALRRVAEVKARQNAVLDARVMEQIRIQAARADSLTLRVLSQVHALGVGRRAVAGVEFTELNPQLATYFRGAQYGLLVLQVAPDTPGDWTGLQPGDVVVRVADRPVHTIAELRAALAWPSDGEVRFTIVRRGEERELVYRSSP